MPKHNKTSFKPGKSGNPKGRPPKGHSITEWFREMLNSQPEVKEAIAQSIVSKALEGDVAAQRMVWNYMDGMPQQQIDHSTQGKPIPAPILGGISVHSNSGDKKDKSAN